MTSSLFFLLWYVSGIIGFWAIFVTINPVITRGDIPKILFGGLLGPLSWIVWLVEFFGQTGSSEKPVKWLSLRRR